MASGQLKEGTYHGNRKWLVIADAVAVGHFLVANLCVLLDQFTTLFIGLPLGGRIPSLQFVYRYMDLPVYSFFRRMISNAETNFTTALLAGEFVIVLSSFLYGLAAYIIVRIGIYVFADE